MKIKHWQGYGCVNMKVLLNTPKLVIVDVYGMHEYGLERDDKYDVCRWLLNRVNGHRNDDYMQIKDLQLEDDYTKENGEYIEHCKYTITLR